MWEILRKSYRVAVSFIKGISQDFSDCGLHNDKYTKFQPCENCELRALCCEWIYPAENIVFFRKDLGSSDLH